MALSWFVSPLIPSSVWSLTFTLEDAHKCWREPLWSPVEWGPVLWRKAWAQGSESQRQCTIFWFLVRAYALEHYWGVSVQFPKVWTRVLWVLENWVHQVLSSKPCHKFESTISDPSSTCDGSRLHHFVTSATCTSIWQSFKKDGTLTENKAPGSKEEGKKRGNSIAPGTARGFTQLQSSAASHLLANRKASCLLWKRHVVKMEPVL